MPQSRPDEPSDLFLAYDAGHLGPPVHGKDRPMREIEVCSSICSKEGEYGTAVKLDVPSGLVWIAFANRAEMMRGSEIIVVFDDDDFEYERIIQR